MSERRSVVVGLASGLTALALLTGALFANEAAMARSVKALQAKARDCLTGGDYDGAFEACRKLQKCKGGAVVAHAIRGEAFERLGRIDEAKEEYRAAYVLGDHVAGGSLAYLNKRKK